MLGKKSVGKNKRIVKTKTVMHENLKQCRMEKITNPKVRTLKKKIEKINQFHKSSPKLIKAKNNKKTQDNKNKNGKVSISVDLH